MMDCVGFRQALISVSSCWISSNLIVRGCYETKKSEQIAFRVSPEDKQRAERVATGLKTTAGALASALLEDFIAARETHGNRLIWPPEVNYYPTNSLSTQEEAGSSSN